MPSAEGGQQASAEALPVFVTVWKQYDRSYVSPYSGRRLESSDNSTHTGRELQNFAETYSNSIQCIKQNDAISFQVVKGSTGPKSNFPVYVRDSIYNSNPKFDYGAFVRLETKMTASDLDIDTFGFTFADLGTYVFADFQTPEEYQTIVFVVSDTEQCKGNPSYPITIANMEKLGIIPGKKGMGSYGQWLHAIPGLFMIVIAITFYALQNWEKKIRDREEELRKQREGAAVNLQKYFKKSQDKFDKLEYLSDLYKLIRENLEEINAQIAENDRRTEEENRDNMNKMLKDKHSLLRELRKGKGDVNLEEIRSGLLQMLSNLRFQDGRSLEEVYKQQMVEERLQKEQIRLDQIEENVSEGPESGSGTESDDKEVAMSEHSQEEEDHLANPEEDKSENNEIISDPQLYDDLLKARDNFKTKREQFEMNIDPTLNQEDKDLILSRYDDQMAKLERELMKDQEDQSNSLKAKLAARQKKNKTVVDGANEDISHTMGQIGDLTKQIEDLELEKDDIQETGINSKGMKREREAEMRARIGEVEKEKDSRLQQMREDYMQRI